MIGTKRGHTRAAQAQRDTKMVIKQLKYEDGQKVWCAFHWYQLLRTIDRSVATSHHSKESLQRKLVLLKTHS